jgi:hypothetical protein
MKPILLVAIIAARASVLAGEPAPRQTPSPPMVAAQAPSAWLGLRLAKPDEMISAHVPSMPPGVGFVVQSIDEGGPAQAAGLLKLDLLWKLGDQMLVNEAQLATLLRLSQPGQEVIVSGFRAGKPLEVKLTLGEAPVLKAPFSGEMVESAIMPGTCGGPMRVVNVAEKSASFSADEGRAVVRRDRDVFKVKITGLKDEVIFEGDLSKERNLDQLPENWRRRIQVLCRTLDHALGGGMEPQRQPQPRVVPHAPKKS